MSKITVYVAYHRNDVPIIKNTIYQPIHVGKANAKVSIDGAIGDNTGDNISKLNPIYCETTATYWAWKNDTESDYIGICHYRRFFSTTKLPLFNRFKRTTWYYSCRLKSCLNPGMQSVMGYMYVNPYKAKFDALISDFEQQISILCGTNSVDVFCLEPLRYAGQNIRSSFAILSSYQIELTERIVKDKYPNISPTLSSVLSGNTLSYANMVIMKREFYGQYCRFLFDVLEQHRVAVVSEGWCKDPLVEKCYSRMSGYIAEILTATFVEYLRNEGRTVHNLTAINYGV